MRNVFICGATLLVVTLSPLSQADMVQLNFSGTNFSSLGVVSPEYSVDNTTFSGSLTYDSSTIGVTDPTFSYVQNYWSAMKSFALTFGDSQYTATSGTISILHGGPNNEDALFIRVYPSGPSIAGLPPYEFDLALRDFSGTVFGSSALPTDFTLSEFQSSGSNTGGGTTNFYVGTYPQLGQFYGLLDTATAVAVPVPEADTYALMLVGLGLVGVAARRRMRCQLPNPTVA